MDKTLHDLLREFVQARRDRDEAVERIDNVITKLAIYMEEMEKK